jgi:hypothetical protein
LNKILFKKSFMLGYIICTRFYSFIIVNLVPGVSKQAELEARLQAQGQDYALISEPVAAASVGLLALAQQSEGYSAGPIQANYLREPDAKFANPKKVSG